MICSRGKDGIFDSPDEKPFENFSMGFSTCSLTGGCAFLGVGLRYESMNFWPFVFSEHKER